jgi:hypothetical protein
MAPILAHWLVSYVRRLDAAGLFRDAALSGLKVVAAAQATCGEKFLEKMGCTIAPALLSGADRPQEMWKEGYVMLGFDAEGAASSACRIATLTGRMGSAARTRTPPARGTQSGASDSDVAEPTIARMLGGSAAQQFGVKLTQKVGG